MTDRADALTLLRVALGQATADFRDGQWEAIDALVNRRERLLVVQRTGWGKSSVYFLATRILRDRRRGPTLIVSPLLALMRNQIDAAERLGVRALTVNSTIAGTDLRSGMKDFVPSCFHSASTGVGNANAAPEGGA